MDLEKFEKLVRLVLVALSKYTGLYPVKRYGDLEAKAKNLLILASKALPEHAKLFTVAYRRIDENVLTVEELRSLIFHILDILEIEKTSRENIREMKIFESAEDKLKQAVLSFRKDDYPSTFHNLNTALELVLKDRLGIPTTITKINTSKIIDILVKHKVGPYPYLIEAKKHVVMIDNKIKHQGYVPSKIECINGIKAMEELISKLRSKEIKVTEEIRNKIYEGL